MRPQFHSALNSSLVLGLFAAGLIVCVASGSSLLWALGFGVVCFSAHAGSTGVPAGEILSLLLKGFLRLSNILAIFVMIGMLTGIWRLSGTIPMLVDIAATMLNPHLFAFWSFLLCGALSSLIGTAFGTVSTLGVVCMITAHAAGFNETIVGGAILSGVFVGDRCSPMSSSAALCCALTHTDLYENIRLMLKTCAVPFALSAALYAALSLMDAEHTMTMDGTRVLRDNFVFGTEALLPALAIVLLAMLRVDVKKAMAAGIVLAVFAALHSQERSLGDVIRALYSYAAPSGELAMLNGGGVRSMAYVIGIVALSSSYSTLFERSGLLRGFKKNIAQLARHLGAFRATTITSLLATGLVCNQTLAVVITHQLCSELTPDRREMAMHLENSAILVSAVIPWSLAFSVCSTTLEQGAQIILTAFYLWGVPLYWCLMPARKKQA